MNPTYNRGLHAILRKAATEMLLGALALLAGCGGKNVTPPPPGGGGGVNPVVPAIPVPAIPVTTYHYDNLRSGWNQQETKLNYSNVSSLSVQAIELNDVNDQVDTQPLIAPNVQIAGGTYNVVYVATEANNIYAFDADTGARLKMVNLGAPVPLPAGGCTQNGPTVGIDGTPVIDLPSLTMYVVTYTVGPAYFIHALDLATLTDKVPPRQITASQTLSDGKTTFKFNPVWERQRPGMLLANGNVYAAFGAFCDGGGDQARGWILGWRAGSLTPLPANLLTNSLPSEPNGMFLSGVWMSGYGIAGDQNGNIYFSTGNSDPGGGTYNENTNISNSVVRLNPDLSRPSPASKSVFTPGNVASLDTQDLDISAGGVMLMPPQPGSPNMAVAAGKDGRMFLLNRDNLGGNTATDTGKLDVVNIGNRCWCGTTYFNDGSPHIVSSGGTTTTGTVGMNPGTSQNSLELWNLQTSPPKLTPAASGNMPDTIQDPGFFTVVSSNGNTNAIIWAVSRPQTNRQHPGIWLYAFKATTSGNTLPLLFQAAAGTWPYVIGNANIVPVVSSGKVYVASYKELDIFGLGLQGALKPKARAKAFVQKALVQVQAQFVKGPEEHQVSGTVRKLDGDHLTIETRDNKTVEIDATEAKNSYRHSAVISVGNGVIAAGSYDANGVMHAVLVWRLKRSLATWPPDR